jgi:hypothetical protein
MHGSEPSLHSFLEFPFLPFMTPLLSSTLAHHTQAIMSVKLSPDATQLVSGGECTD